MPAIVLYQPDIPQNLGALLRLSACLALPVHVIEPCGFPLDDAKLRRAGMDYIQHATLTRHKSWEHFREHQAAHPGRLVLCETDGQTPLFDFSFAATDYLLFGRESAGTPRELYAHMDASLHIPMRPGARSLNLAMSAGMIATEVYRQLRWDF
jgi:tRNA (cytidine/uridine-2'-O-)-methyltransferase